MHQLFLYRQSKITFNTSCKNNRLQKRKLAISEFYYILLHKIASENQRADYLNRKIYISETTHLNINK